MKKRIGAVVAGVGGFHLALVLTQHDIDITIIIDRTAAQFAKARLPNTAAHLAATLELGR